MFPATPGLVALSLASKTSRWSELLQPSLCPSAAQDMPTRSISSYGPCIQCLCQSESAHAHQITRQRSRVGCSLPQGGEAAAQQGRSLGAGMARAKARPRGRSHGESAEAAGSASPAPAPAPKRAKTTRTTAAVELPDDACGICGQMKGNQALRGKRYSNMVSQWVSVCAQAAMIYN